MAQYDVFQNLNGSGYLLDVQSDLLDGLSSRLVIPSLPSLQAPMPAARLNPVVSIKDEAHVMATQFMAAVPQKVLTAHVTTLAPMRDDITAAIDMLTHGFYTLSQRHVQSKPPARAAATRP